MMWPVGKFYEDNNDLAEDEIRFAVIFDARGHENIGDMVRRGRQCQRFLYFIGRGVSEDREEFESLFLGSSVLLALSLHTPPYQTCQRSRKAHILTFGG